MSDVLVVLVPALAMALLQFLWQGALVGLFAWLALSMLRDARPQARYAVACLALLACTVLPAWNLVQTLSGYGTTATTSFPFDNAVSGSALAGRSDNGLRALFAPSLDLLPGIVALWAAGVALLSLRMACGLLWVDRLCRAAEEEAGCWQLRVDALALTLGIHRHVTLRLVQVGDGPVTAGWWRPVVVVPMAIATRMPVELLEALIAHELAHIRRHDYLVNLLQGAVEALLFYHPVVWWLSHRIRIERERVADELAAAALGDRRRLALALSELDRLASEGLAPERLPALQPHYAPAAHGGHLMSRIQQLVRPDRRIAGTSLALPLLGLALAGVAFYAHAQLAVPSKASASAGGDRPTYALVRGDRDSMTMYGNTDDADAINDARERIEGDFLWFRRDGKAWVARDAGTVAHARDAWARTDAISEEMHALEVRMKPHSERIEALSGQMEALDRDNAFESPEARAATEKMEALGGRMQALSERQMALAQRMRQATEADQPQLERDRDSLERQQETLNQELERHNATLEALNERMAAQHQPMEALAREMEAASKPMDAIGKEMEAVGKRIEREAAVADRQMRKLIEEVYRSGRAEPVPAPRQ